MLISAATVLLTNCSLYLHGLRLQGELAEPCCVQCPHPEHIFLSRHQSVADEPADFPFRITFITHLAKVLTSLRAVIFTWYHSQVCCCTAPTHCCPQCCPQCSSQSTLWHHGRPPRTQPRTYQCFWWGPLSLGPMGYLWARMFVYLLFICCCYDAVEQHFVLWPSLSPTVVASVGSDGSPTPAELQQRTRKL